MRLRTALILLTILFSSLVALASPDKGDVKRRRTKIERKMPSDSQVSVSLCVSSGSITVKGWDRDEVRAFSSEAADIELRRKDEGTGTAKKINVRVSDKKGEPNPGDPCEAYSEIELNVPRGATVQLQTRDSDINVAEVATVYINTQNGSVSIEHATRNVDAGSIGGDVSLRDSSGRISLHTAGGSIDATDVRPADAGDTFEARTLGGEITLERVSHSQVSAYTLNGSLSVTGPLAHGGRYNYRTMSGDMTLSMPEDASFQLSARFAQSAEIITDFPLTLIPLTGVKPAPKPSPAPAVPPTSPAKPAPQVTPLPPHPEEGDVVAKVKTKKNTVVVEVPSGLRRLEGIHGTGDAKLEVASFSGTIHLQKQ